MPTDMELLRRHGFVFSKAMGQNFLMDPGVCPRMAALCGADQHSGVLEIGPGAGTLTRALAEVAGKVVAIELDKRLLPVLEESLAGRSNVTVLQGDALAMDLHALLREQFSGMEVRVCANLPYYITSPLLMHLLESRLPLQSITVMVQKEAAQRLCAPMGTRACGAISAAVQYYAQPRMLFPVSRGAFFPVPGVDSAVMQLTLRQCPPVAVADEAALFRLVRAAFGQRRKTAANAVSAGLCLEKQQVLAAMAQAGLSASVRAEAIPLEGYAALLSALEESAS